MQNTTTIVFTVYAHKHNKGNQVHGDNKKQFHELLSFFFFGPASETKGILVPQSIED